MHGFTVFDNNAYKRATRDRIMRINQAERSKGIVALASVVVLQEMLARVRDEQGERRSVNRAAIRKLGLHSGVLRDDKTIVGFVGHTDSQVYRLIRGNDHRGDAEMFEQLGQLVGAVTEAESNDPLHEVAPTLAAIETTVANVEAAYVRGLEAANNGAFEPNRMKRNLNYAAEVASRAGNHYGETFHPEDTVLHVIHIAKATSIGFALRDSVIAEVRGKRGGHRRHANTVWDEEVVSATSMYTTIAGKTVLLVTEEDRLLEAAASVGASDRVCRLAAYEAMLGLPTWPPPLST